MDGARTTPYRLSCSILAVAVLTGIAPARGECLDRDRDGYGRPGDPTCPQGGAEDCNDSDVLMFPGNPEVCDGFDNDCNGLMDDGAGCTQELTDIEKVGNSELLDDRVGQFEPPALCWDGRGYGLAYLANFNNNAAVHFMRIDGKGNVLIPQRPIWFQDLSQGDADIAWTGTEYGVCWESYLDGVDGREILFMRINRQGENIGDVVRVTDAPGFSTQPKLAWSGREYGIVWLDERPGGEDAIERLYFARIDAEGAVSNETPLDISSDGAVDATIVWNGREFGVAAMTTNVESENNTYWFLRLDPNGTLILPPIDLGTAGSGFENIELTWSGAEYGVWWREGGVLLTRLDSSGDFIDEHDVTSERQHPVPTDFHTATWNGSEYGLLWVYLNNPVVPVSFALRFTRISSVGEMLGSPGEREIKLSPDDYFQRRSDISWNGRGFGILYNDRLGTYTDLFFTRTAQDLDADGYYGVADCNDGDIDLWSVPGPTRDLRIDPDRESIRWLSPDEPGTNRSLRYDLIRSSVANDFTQGVCVGEDLASTHATDPAEPAVRAFFYYLSRANNDCGTGSVGRGSDGTPRQAEPCSE